MKKINDGVNIGGADLHSFLMIGQSNMAGRGSISDVSPIENYRCYMFRMGRFQRMREPLNVDRAVFGTAGPISGISLGASFADEYAKHYSTRVGMIPCADGGTRLDEWLPGTPLYDHAVFMARLAMRSSSFSGILWHQGESDCTDDSDIKVYKEKFIGMISSMRSELGAENLPLIIGELSENLSNPNYHFEDRPIRLNKILREISEELPMCTLVSSKGLTLKSDLLHFDALSQREFGKRYFEAYRDLML